MNTIDGTLLARRAMRAALELRRSCAISRDSAINIFDLAEGLGIRVRFVDCKTLEGMYVRDPGPRIFLPSTLHRPWGRIAFSCAHEVAHHVFGHGTRVDKYLKDTPRSRWKDPAERMADIFAGYILMPRQSVVSAFRKRGWRIETPEPIEVYAAAGNLGVGYTTLLTHMRRTLELLNEAQFKQLAKSSPKDLCASVCGESAPKRLLFVDQHWGPTPVDLEVGDYCVMPQHTEFHSNHLAVVRTISAGQIVCAHRQGDTTVGCSSIPIRIRIACEGFVGMHQYRFLEAVNDDD